VEGSGKSIGAQAAAGAFWSAAGFACLSLCGYFIAIMLARGLGPAAFGVYGVVYSLLLASEQVLRFGIPQAMTRLIGGGLAQDPARLEATGVWLALLVNLAGFAVLWAAAPALAGWLNLEDGALYIRIAILDLPFFGVYRVLTHSLSGRRNFRASGLATCVYGISRAAGIAVLLAMDALTIPGALIANAAASLIGLLFAAPFAGAKSFRPTVSERRSVAATAVPITISDVAVQCLLGIDLWLLSATGDSLAVGVRGEYVAAMNLARGPNLIAFVLVTVLVPLIARAQSTGQHEAAQRLVTGTTRFLATLVLPACALIAANAAPLMALFFGEKFREGGTFLAILVFAQGFGFTALACFQAIMIGVGRAAVTARRAYVALAVAIVLNLALIPLLGATGAAVAALLAFSVVNLLVGWAIRREIGALLDVRRSLVAAAAAIAVAAVSWWIPSEGIAVLVEMSVLALAWLAIAWWLGLVDRADFALLRGKSRGAGPTAG